jgi:hypothetical protein
MTPIRRPLAGLLTLFLGALAMDRMALDGAAERTLGTPVYAIALAFVAAPLLSGGFRRSRPLAVLTMAVGATVLTQAAAGRLTGDPYHAAVEVAFVGLAAGLGHRLAFVIDRIDRTINSVVFGDNPALPLDGRQAANEILTEMARSRRHGRPLSVTVLAPDPASLEVAADRSAEEIQRAIRARYVHGRVARAIAGQLRRSDLLFEDPATGNFVVVSPETSSEGTGLLVDRINGAIEPTAVRMESGHATFPDHALTFEQLVERAQRHIGEQPVAFSVPEEGAA